MSSDEMTLIDFRSDESEPDDQPVDTEPSRSASATEPPAVPWVLVVVILVVVLLVGGLLLSTTLPV